MSIQLNAAGRDPARQLVDADPYLKDSDGS